MTHGQVVKDHMIKIIGYFNEAYINGSQNDKETQFDMILNSITNTFD